MGEGHINSSALMSPIIANWKKFLKNISIGDDGRHKGITYMEPAARRGGSGGRSPLVRGPKNIALDRVVRLG